jgi:GntR family transcriptional regulator/MocR family aminotransferase
MVHLTTALDAASAVPLYEQLYQSLAQEMRTGALAAGTRMPGKRRLAAELSVSVNTVDAAYQMLAAEGYLESRERSGFYVQEYLALPARPAGVPEPQPLHLPEPPPAPPVRYDLSTRGVDPGLFPFRTWARLQKELLYSSPELLTHGDAQGDPALRQALAEYLSEYRGVQCGAHQIVVGAGLEYLLGLLAPLLPGTAAVETPGYPRARQVLENNGVRCCCLPVDADGLSLAALNRSEAAVCYVTPSHQFPTGVTMPPGRAAALGGPQPRPAVHHRGRLRLGVPFRHPAAAKPAGHGGSRWAGGVPLHLFPQSGTQHPHCLYGAAGTSAARVAGKIPALFRNGEPV